MLSAATTMMMEERSGGIEQQGVVSPPDAPRSRESPTSRSASASTLLSKLLSAEGISDGAADLLEGGLDEVPWLDQSNVEALEHGSVVRIRGFVQDMFDAEYYCLPNNESVSGSLRGPSLTERTPVFITPIPFTMSWYRKSSAPDVSCQRQTKKLRMSPVSELLEQHEQQSNNNDNSIAENPSSRSKPEKWWKPSTMGSDPAQVPVLAKFYYEQYHTPNRVRLNEVVELLGVLDLEESSQQENPGMDNSSSSSHESMMELDGSLLDEAPALTLPHKVPRVHVLTFQNCLPLESKDAPPMSAILPGQWQPSPQACLAQALSLPESPVVTALYLTLLSKAEREQKTAGGTAFGAPSITPLGSTLGCASLNITLPDASSCRRFQATLEQTLAEIVPVLQSKMVTPETLGSKLSFPAKKRGRILPHDVQLPKGATLLLNVAEMRAGRLSPEQTCALQGLQTMTSSHKLDYQFDGNMRIPFEADWRIIVLSTPTTHKLLPCTMQTKYTLCPEGAASPSKSSSSRDSAVAALRVYMAKSRSLANINLSPTVQERAPRLFCEVRESLRQQQQSSASSSLKRITEEDFHRWLTWTRLYARHRGSDVAEMTDFDQAVALDRALSDDNN